MAIEADLVDEIGCWERAKARAEARQLRAMAELARRPMFAGCAEHGDDDPTHGVRGAASVVSAELRISPGNARARVELACELVEQLPAVLDALAAGRLDGYEARVIAEETRPLADRTGLRADVVDRLLAKADRQRGRSYGPPPARLCWRPIRPARRSGMTGPARPRVPPTVPEPDGMASALLRLPAEDMAAFFTPSMLPLGTSRPPTRSIRGRSNRSAPTSWLTWAGPPSRRWAPRLQQPRLRPRVHAAWYEARPGRARRRRRAAVHLARHRRPTGAPGGVRADHRRSRPPARRRRGLAAAAHRPGDRRFARLRHHPLHPARRLGRLHRRRDRTCRFPTCTWPAESCDADQTVPADDGGPTAEGNLGPLHRAHHVDKTHHGWLLSQPEPGRFIWTSPTGHSYEVDPEIIGPLVAGTPVSEPPPEVDPNPPPF